MAHVFKQPRVVQLVPGDHGVHAAVFEHVQKLLQRVVAAQEFLGQGHATLEKIALFVDAHRAAGRQRTAAFLHGAVQGFQKIRVQQVVGIHIADVIAGSGVQPGVGSGCGTAVFLVYHPDAGVGLGQLVAKLAAAVGAAVLYEDQLKIGKALGQDALYG